MLTNAQNCTMYTKKQIPLQKYFKSYVYCKKAWRGVPCEQFLIDFSKPFLCRCSACKMIPWMKGEAKEAKNPIFKKYLSQVKRVEDYRKILPPRYSYLACLTLTPSPPPPLPPLKPSCPPLLPFEMKSCTMFFINLLRFNLTLVEYSQHWQIVLLYQSPIWWLHLSIYPPISLSSHLSIYP